MAYSMALLTSRQPSRDLVAYGDSLTAGTLVAGSSDWMPNLALLYPKSAYTNQALGGTDSATIAATQVTDLAVSGKPYRDRMCIIWAGANDYTEPGWDGSTTYANIMAMVARCRTNWFRVLEPIPKSYSLMYTGTAMSNSRLALVANLTAALGSRLVLLTAHLQAGGNGGTQDNADIANGIIPTSLRQPSDTIHMTTMLTAGLLGGNGIVYTQVAASLAGGF